MKREEKERIDRLLGRGRLSGPAREEILELALRGAGLEERPFWRRLLWLPPALAAASACMLLLVARPKAPEFRAKGGPAGGMPVEVLCTGGSVEHCPHTAKLVFRVEPTTEPRYLSAYATPLGGGGERIWFSPRIGQDPMLVPPAGESRVLAQGIDLERLPPGAYAMELFLTRKPVHREELERPDDVPSDSHASTRVEVLP